MTPRPVQAPRIAALLAACLLALAALALVAQPPALAGAEPGVAVSSVQTEGAATVDLTASNVLDPGLGAWVITILYDNEVIQPTDTCISPPTLNTFCNLDFREDKVRIGGFSPGGITGDFLIVTIGFQCIAVGESPLMLTVVEFADTEQQPINPEIENGVFHCAAPLNGDVLCSGAVTSTDALMILRSVAGLPHGADCLPLAGDVNCDGNVNAVDALGILRHVAGLPPLAAAPGCTPIGQPL